ncbi:MAG TPA: hypothetical protein DCL81_00815 [Algoriphagus sp.]|jgi:hypothetical protein|uniref:hypothetical protein n=1 Tax=Algoriphagus sp. TaxID=1872435 RepID=UPI000C4185E7|nr:hypothetical protein [Algoriphagus sp.]MAL13336.1 hypothetical protein [Algoriphagus sp.]MAN85598.1 hypothetical protein [Algoriphagus sp.]HAD52687.1 hypothetical protein [Algoriphagus sp.]HAH35131.1 hypothetical protein [Algoriphagus sp.]HAS57958.1 hypothetical protein [Algoriphagus sp.]|tara:strand:- start:3064 stop:3270 length:207 start_codon:yes stop_codon:yes gene_type:complete
MTDHEKFKALLDSVGLTYASLAEKMGFTYNSIKSMLAPAKELPKWAKSMLILSERWEKIKEKDSEDGG